MSERAALRRSGVCLRLNVVAAIAATCLFLVGCVGIDSRAEQEPVDKEATRNITGRFLNFCGYCSEMPFGSGAPSFAGLVGVPGAYSANSFSVSFTETGALTFEFEVGGRTVGGRTFQPQDGLHFNEEGKIELLHCRGCEIADIPAMGCGSQTVTVFLNPDGDLVAVETGGGAGLLIVVPFAAYGTTMSIFPRVS